jgi:hypothetical protein
MIVREVLKVLELEVKHSQEQWRNFDEIDGSLL